MIRDSGLKDTAGKMIREGDVVEVLFGDGKRRSAAITFVDGCFEIKTFESFPHPNYPDRPTTRDYLKCYTVNHAVTIKKGVQE